MLSITNITLSSSSKSVLGYLFHVFLEVKVSGDDRGPSETLLLWIKLHFSHFAHLILLLWGPCVPCSWDLRLKKHCQLPVDFVCQDVFLGRDLNLRWSDYTAVPFLFSTYLTPLMSSQSFSQPSEDEESWMSKVTIVTEIRYPGNGAWKWHRRGEQKEG